MNISNKYTSGWDVGGAHLKVVMVDADRRVVQVVQLPCPLWQGMAQLSQAVDQALLALNQPAAAHAVTMTGELADVFSGRRQGVNEISRLMAAKLGAGTCFYAAADGFVGLPQVDDCHRQIASANWHASVSLLASRLPQGLFVDIGSTTSDLIPFSEGHALNRGFTDAERMRNDELVYTGVVRTPLMALAPAIMFRGEAYHVAAELFATTADIYRITGDLMETEDMAATADGSEKSLQGSMRRLARMLGHDDEDAGDGDWMALAQAFKTVQLQQLRRAVERLLARGRLSMDAPLVAAGAGRFLAHALADELQRDCLEAEQLIDAETPELRRWAGVCFPAYAVATLLPQAGA